METVREQLRDTQEREEHARSEMTKYQLEYAEAKASNTELQKLVDGISTHQTASGNDTGQEWAFEEDDGGAYMSLSSQSVYRGQSLHQPTLEAFDEEESLASLPASKGVVRFELTQILEQKKQLEQDLEDLDGELRLAKGQVHNEKDENKRLTSKIREFTREIAELKSTARGHTHREIDLDDQRKKAESKVRNLELEMKTLKEGTEQEVLEARKFAEDTGRERNAALKENGHLKTRLEDAEHRLETELPALQQKNSDMMAVLMQVAGAFHQRFAEGDDHAFVQSQLQMLATYFSDPAK
jgi:chromosome segregation ATPase